MIADARTLPEGHTIQADICIVGGGAAGITAAMELIGSGLSVAVLESGGYEYDPRTQSLYKGKNIGVQSWSLDDQRLRYLGGSTNHWAGNAMRLDAIDFEKREGVPHSGWPFGLDELDPYYDRAQGIVQTPAGSPYNTPERRREMHGKALAFDPARFRTRIYGRSPPTRFGEVYRDVLAGAENVTVYLYANVLEVEANETASAVTGLSVACIDGPRFRATARVYVLAMGGIEIPRVLLLSKRVQSVGLGNGNDLVGRFFMDHRSIRPAMKVLLNRKLVEDLALYFDEQKVPGGVLTALIAASPDLLRREHLGNFTFSTPLDVNRSPGEESAREVLWDVRNKRIPSHIGEHIVNVVTDLDGVTNDIYHVLAETEQDLIERDWLDPWLGVETLPHPDSRVTLIEERDDIFGQNRIALDWRLTGDELRIAERATELLTMELGRLGYGRTWSRLLMERDWPERVDHGQHHIGTTRMSNDPKTGVVDADCKVHGIANLFIAGSAVFPTSGAATPTLTIVALTIRLAHHLRDLALNGGL